MDNQIKKPTMPLKKIMRATYAIASAILATLALTIGLYSDLIDLNIIPYFTNPSLETAQLTNHAEQITLFQENYNRAISFTTAGVINTQNDNINLARLDFNNAILIFIELTEQKPGNDKLKHNLIDSYLGLAKAENKTDNKINSQINIKKAKDVAGGLTNDKNFHYQVTQKIHNVELSLSDGAYKEKIKTKNESF